MSYIKHILDYLKNSFSILVSGNFELWYKYTYVLFLTLIRVKPLRETTTVFIGWHTIRIPYNFVSCLVLQEIFVDKLYKRLHGLNHILDLGWFVGESALYLSHINKAVTVVESDPRNVELCKENTQYVSNITVHHAAVVSEHTGDLYIHKTNEYRGDISSHPGENAVKIHSIAISELEKQGFDGIKIDIEWWEYDLLEYRKKTWVFTYKKGFIEFHFDSKKPERDICAHDFVTFLQEEWYNVDFFTNNATIISTIDFMRSLANHTNKEQYMNLYFEK